MRLERRKFLQLLGLGLAGGVTAPLIFHDSPLVNALRDSARLPMFGSRRPRSVVFLTMHGAPSQIDTFDYKPELEKSDGKKISGNRIVSEKKQEGGVLMKSPWKFRQAGQAGHWVSELFPEFSRHLDDITLIHSCTSKSNSHGIALFYMNTGNIQGGFPNLGSWINWAIGSEAKDLPGSIVLTDKRGAPRNGNMNWNESPLSAVFRPMSLQLGESSVPDLHPPLGMNEVRREKQIELINKLNREHLAMAGSQDQLLSRIEHYEKVQTFQRELALATDLSSESEQTKERYRFNNEMTEPFARQLLTARKLLERGVRYVQVYHGGNADNDNWDAHVDIRMHQHRAFETDKPMAAFMDDLKQRGLLDETLVLWGGEYGRLPVIEQPAEGRDHNHEGFTVWMAGCGIKRGFRFGETDELGHKAVVDPVSYGDIHATILHLLGIDHRKLEFTHNGNQIRLTNLSNEPIRKILA